MGQRSRILTSSAWLVLWAAMAVQSASAQSGGYPPADEVWNSTSYAILVERVEAGSVTLPTLSGAATKPVFDRMVNIENTPLHMGLNPKLSVTLRFQKLEPVLQPLHKLVSLYANETQKGKPYASELARLMVFEAKAAGTLLEITEPFILTLTKDKRYQAQVDNINKLKDDARQIYSGLVRSMSETSLYSKPDMLQLISAAFAGLRSYHPIFTNQDRQDLIQKLTQQISKTTDSELKTALTELRDGIEHRRIPT